MAFTVAILIRLYHEVWSNTAVVGGYFGPPGSTAFIGSALLGGMQHGREGKSNAVAESDARFHGRILQIADNRTLITVWGSLEPFLRTYITLVVPGADPQWSADLHPPILAALDTNKDGVIDADEIAKSAESLKTLDKNGDGKLTEDELHPPRPEGQGGPGGKGGKDGGPGGPGGKPPKP